MSVVRLIVATRNSGPPARGKIIKEIPASVASGTPYISRQNIGMLLNVHAMICFNFKYNLNSEIRKNYVSVIVNFHTVLR